MLFKNKYLHRYLVINNNMLDRYTALQWPSSSAVTLYQLQTTRYLYLPRPYTISINLKQGKGLPMQRKHLACLAVVVVCYCLVQMLLWLFISYMTGSARRILLITKPHDIICISIHSPFFLFFVRMKCSASLIFLFSSVHFHKKESNYCVCCKSFSMKLF